MMNDFYLNPSPWHHCCKSISYPPGVYFAQRNLQAASSNPNYPISMLSWTLTFIIVALIAGVLGFGGLAGAAAGVAKVCFFLFLVLFVVSLLRGKKSI
jgi:uncharacterized membrane protein YtjA (UPF0391 family)